MTDFESEAVSGFVIFGPLVEEELTLLAVEKSASIRYFNGTLVSRLELLGKLISEMKTFFGYTIVHIKDNIRNLEKLDLFCDE